MPFSEQVCVAQLMQGRKLQRVSGCAASRVWSVCKAPSSMLPHGKQDLSVVTAHQADPVQADNRAALQREAALVEEKGQLKLALTTALEQKASTSGALAEAEGRLQEATQQVCGLRQTSRP